MIDLCIVNYNTRPLLERFLNTLHSDKNEENKVWNLYITDNDSKDDFIPWIRHMDESYSINRLYLRENIGYSAACNMMASKGDGEIIALLNGDVWMSSEDVKKVKFIFDNNKDVHILGPKQRDENGHITHAGIVGTNTAPRHRGWREHDPNDELYKDQIECVTISGSAYFIRRDVWDSMTNNPQYRDLFPNAVGAFLPTPHYYEETWCSYFARHLGYNVVYDGSVSIGHSWHASTPKPGEGISHADKYFPISREIFRRACDHFGIERD